MPNRRPRRQRSWIRGLLWLLVLALCGCPGHAGKGANLLDPLGGIQLPPSNFAIKGRMYLTVRAPRWGVSGTTSTTMVVHRPDDFYLQVRGPVNNVMVQGTLNREEAVVVIPPMNKVFVGESPDAAMRALTGGAMGVDGLLALLLARLPDEDLEVKNTQLAGKIAEISLETAGGYQLKATVQRIRSLLSDLQLYDTDGEHLMSVSYDGRFRDARNYLPRLLTMAIPGLELSVKADFQAWEVMGDIPDIFTTPKPANAELLDLEEALRSGVTAAQAPEPGGEPAEHPRP